MVFFPYASLVVTSIASSAPSTQTSHITTRATTEQQSTEVTTQEIGKAQTKFTTETSTGDNGLRSTPVVSTEGYKDAHNTEETERTPQTTSTILTSTQSQMTTYEELTSESTTEVFEAMTTSASIRD